MVEAPTISKSNRLSGYRVLVTRPAHQAAPLLALLQQGGAGVEHLPCIEILPPAKPSELKSALMALGRVDIAVFVSRNAADSVLRAAQKWARAKPTSLNIAAIGKATARALNAGGWQVDIAPAGDRNDSEALLAELNAASMRDKHVVIFKGQGGRELLRQELIAKGAIVSEVQAYRRQVPAADPGRIADLFGPGGTIDILTATSLEIVQNLLALAGPEYRKALFGKPLVVMSERIARSAEKLGFERVLVSAGMSDHAMVEAVDAALNPTTQHMK